MVVSRVTFICALRSTDLERLGHPKLTREPLEVLEAVVDGTWVVVKLEGLY